MKKYEQYLNSEKWEFVPYSDKKMGFGGGVDNYNTNRNGMHPTVEVEKGEVVQLPNGLIDMVNSGGSHEEMTDGSYGTPMNLESGSKVFSENLKHPETKKSFSKMAKKFETVKDIEHADSKFSDYINKDTAELNIKLKNQESDKLFEEQEVMKLDGTFGSKVKKEAMKNLKAKYGAEVPMTTVYPPSDMFMENGGLMKAGNGKTLRGTGKDVENNFKDLDEVYQNYKAHGYTGAKDITQMREWSYKVNPQEVNAYITRTRPTNAHRKIWKEEYKGTGEPDFQKMDRKDVFRGYNDKLWDFRAYKFNDSPTNQTLPSPLQTKERPSTELQKEGNPPSQGRFNKLNFRAPAVFAGIPEAYQRDAITVNNLSPEYYQPHVISPYINDIQRAQYTANQNLGSSGAELATRANVFGQGVNEYGKRYYDTNTYNANAITQASRENAQTRLGVNKYNMENYINNARNPQLQREATITDQKRINQNGLMEDMTDYNHQNDVTDYLSSIYNPEMAFNTNYTVNPYGLKSAKAEREEAKKAEALKTLGLAKYGKRINTKKFKKKSK